MYGDNYSPAMFADELTDTDIDKAIELLQLMKKRVIPELFLRIII